MSIHIRWNNVADDAGFGLFGIHAALARNIVQQAIIDWENVIVSFNGKNANFAGDVVNLKVFIQLADSTISSGGYLLLPDGSTGYGIVLGFDRKSPTGGWYLSPNPSTNADFRADPREPQFAGTLATGRGSDLLSDALHEIGHVLGALTVDPAFGPTNRLPSGAYLTPTGASTTDALRRPVPIYWFHFPNGVTAPLMEPPWDRGAPTGVGHMFAGTATTSAGATITGRLDVMNPTQESGERYLISDYDAYILEDVLGCSVNVPSKMGWVITNPAPAAPRRP